LLQLISSEGILAEYKYHPSEHAVVIYKKTVFSYPWHCDGLWEPFMVCFSDTFMVLFPKNVFLYISVSRKY